MKPEQKADYIYDSILHYIWGDTILLKGEDAREYLFIAKKFIKNNDENSIVVMENDSKTRENLIKEIENKKNVRITYIDIEHNRDFNTALYTKIKMNSILWMYPKSITTDIIYKLYEILHKHGILCMVIKTKDLDDDVLSDIIFHSGFDEIRRFHIFRFPNMSLKITDFLDRFNGYKKGFLTVIVYAKNH